jgi:predicted phage terminase large subunit-like protein
MSIDADTPFDPAALAERDPLAHPAVTSVRLFDYSTPPGDHLIELYNAVFMAVDPAFPNAAARVARLMPRGHGKTEGGGVVVPAWAILRHPDIRVAIISVKEGLAEGRTEKVINAVERNAEQFGIEIDSSSKTELTTAAGSHHKEATISAWGLQSDPTGEHFDLIIYDDVSVWDNQRTEVQRRNTRAYFQDYVDNLASNDSVLDDGPVQVYIGTRKHAQDLWATEIADSATWDTDVYRAVHPADWGVIEARDWQVRGTDGKMYDGVADLPADVNVAPNGVHPNRDVRVLWRDFQPPEALLYDIVDGDDSVAVWRRENQQDPDALSGEVLTSEMLIYEDALPTTDAGEPKPLTWVAGLDIAQVDDPQKAAEGDGDFYAIAIIGFDSDAERAYLTHLARERGMSTLEAKRWVVDHVTGRQPEYREHTTPVSPGFTLSKLLVEQNAGRGVGQRLRDDTAIPADNVSSSGDKNARIHNLAADFQGGDLRIVGDPTAEPWRTFEVAEWLPFPTAAHDDMLDAVELAMRAVDIGTVPTATASVGGQEYADGVDPNSDGAALTDAVREFQEKHRKASGGNPYK